MTLDRLMGTRIKLLLFSPGPEPQIDNRGYQIDSANCN
jgi:hypothetical protein